MLINFEEIIVVDENDVVIGLCDKMKVHKEGIRHRAFSVLVFNKHNEMLLQQRAFNKYHSPGLWTNTCCSHPISGEKTKAAAIRRLEEEMGIRISNLEEIGIFKYSVKLGELYENEIDHVFVGFSEQRPVVDSNEVADWKWMSMDAVVAEIRQGQTNYTYWFKGIINMFLRQIYDVIDSRDV